jgi:nucleotide-binding universal stress UspA family protein
MFTRILVPLDGSNNAEKALPYARALARALEIPVTLMTVVETGTDFFSKKVRHLETLIKDSLRSSEEYLKRISKTFSGAAIQYKVEKGRAEDAIIVNAAADNGTLITMATHGRSGLGRWLLGSITEKVVRGANNPVLWYGRPKKPAQKVKRRRIRSLSLSMAPPCRNPFCRTSSSWRKLSMQSHARTA